MQRSLERSPDPDEPLDRADGTQPGRTSYSDGKRTNHWGTRNPDDFISYPRSEAWDYLVEMRLIQCAQQGDINARNAVWMHHARLTLSVVNCFRIPEHLLSDAIQEGCIGLKRAIEKFEVERLNSFSTYAWQWIYQSVQRFLVYNVLPLRVPPLLFSDYLRFRRELRRCREPGDEAAVVDRWWQANSGLYTRIVRLHAVVVIRPTHFIDEAEHPCISDEEIDETPNWTDICREALRVLKHRDRSIIEKRYGLFGGRTMNLRELGEEENVTRERIRQIQFRAEKKLQRRCAHLRQLIEPMKDEATGV